MSNDAWIVFFGMAFVAIIASMWSAKRVDAQHAKASELLLSNQDLVQASQAQQIEVDRQLKNSADSQARESALLDRWEAVIAKIEALMEQGVMNRIR